MAQTVSHPSTSHARHGRAATGLKPSVLLGDTTKPKKKKVDAPRVLSKEEQVEAVKLMSQRLKAAREISGFNLTEASAKFGFANPGSLSKIESGKHVSAIPLWFIPRAAIVYGVSTEYLHGLSEQLEPKAGVNMSRDMGLWLFGAMEKQLQAYVDKLSYLQEEVELIFTSTRDLALAAERSSETFEEFRGLNTRQFNVLKGGSKLVLHMAELMTTAGTTGAKLTKFKNTFRAASASVPEIAQMPLDLAGVNGLG